MTLPAETLRSEIAAKIDAVAAETVARVLKPCPVDPIAAIYAEWIIAPRRTSAEHLAHCRKLLAAQEAKGRAGHWTYDHNRHIALRQAEAALAVLADEPLPLSNAA